MNERIKELAELAEKYADDNFKGQPTYSEAHDSKFAELIVRECGEVAYKAYWDNPETVRGIHIQEKIKEHFGVKE
jgi:hypothetical protein